MPFHGFPNGNYHWNHGSSFVMVHCVFNTRHKLFGSGLGFQEHLRRQIIFLVYIKKKSFFFFWPCPWQWQSQILNPLGHQETPKYFKEVFVCLFCFCLFRAALTAYGSSQARGRIGSTAASLHHSHSQATAEQRLWPMPQLRAMRDP